MKKIIFVCTGNTCRSPMAEGIANVLLENEYEAQSFGLCATIGDPVSENAVIAMNEIGIDISSHKAKQLTLEAAESADIIAALSASHFGYLSQVDTIKNKLCILGNGISDPFMQDLDVYRKCRDEIRQAIADMFLQVQISHMTADDVSQIARIEADTFSSAWSENGISSELNNPNSHFIVAKYAGRVLGYTGFLLCADEAYMANIAVRKEYRGIGIGKKLMTNLSDLAKSLNARFLTLEVRQSNDIAKHLYENLGFSKVGERKNFYVKPTENADLYTLYF